MGKSGGQKPFQRVHVVILVRRVKQTQQAQTSNQNRENQPYFEIDFSHAFSSKSSITIADASEAEVLSLFSLLYKNSKENFFLPGEGFLLPDKNSGPTLALEI
jgi:hypothetical protein